MKTKHCFVFVLMTFLTIAGLVVSAAAAPLPPKPKPLSCSLMGTWSGWADRDWVSDRLPSLAWTAVQSAGSSPNTGGIVTSWVPTPRDIFLGTGAHLTDGHGLWQGNGSQFNYTWYAYLVGDDPTNTTTYKQTVASIRAYGLVAFQTDCNNATITYTFDLFNGMVAPDKMSYDNPSFGGTLTGGGGETRAPLVVPAPAP